MDREIAFSEVSPSQAELVESLARQIWPVVYTGIISPEQVDYMLSHMYDPVTIRREISELKIRYLLVQIEGEPIGFSAFGPLREKEICFLHKIYVRPELQGRGIGSRVLSEVEKQIRVGRGIGLELRVNRHNESAINFYHKNGLEIVRKDCAEIGGGYVMDDFVFRKEFE